MMWATTIANTYSEEPDAEPERDSVAVAGFVKNRTSKEDTNHVILFTSADKNLPATAETTRSNRASPMLFT